MREVRDLSLCESEFHGKESGAVRESLMNYICRKDREQTKTLAVHCDAVASRTVQRLGARKRCIVCIYKNMYLHMCVYLFICVYVCVSVFFCRCAVSCRVPRVVGWLVVVWCGVWCGVVWCGVVCCCRHVVVVVVLVLGPSCFA